MFMKGLLELAKKKTHFLTSLLLQTGSSIQVSNRFAVGQFSNKKHLGILNVGLRYELWVGTY